MENKNNEKVIEGLYDEFYDSRSSTLVLFTRNKEKKKICKLIKQFKPYLYLTTEAYRKYEPLLQPLVTQTEYVTDKIPLIPTEKKLVKVYFKNSYDQFKIKELIWETESVYEGDIQVSQRYIIDNVDELQNSDFRLNYFDIETTSIKGFPIYKNPVEQIISIVSYDNYLNKYMVWIWHDKYHKEELEKKINNDVSEVVNTIFVKRFNNEKDMLENFIQFLASTQPDFMIAWNIQFDIRYLIARCERIGINIKRLSPLYNSLFKSNKNIVKWMQGAGLYGKMFSMNDRDEQHIQIAGLQFFDLLSAYKKINAKEQESWKLDYIAKVELGEQKLRTHFDIGTKWLTSPEFIEDYNYKDVELIKRLDDKIKIFQYFINVKNSAFLIKINDVFSSGKVLDTYVLKKYKDKYIFPSKAGYDPQRERIPVGGGFVRSSKPGVYNNVAVFDFAGYYPNLIKMFNLSGDTIRHSNVMTLDVDAEEEQNISELQNKMYDYDKDKQLITYKIRTDKFKADLTYDVSRKGVMAESVQALMELRNIAKKEAAQYKYGSPEYEQKDKVQFSYKFIINAAYGTSGYPGFRLYSNENANAITAFARMLSKYVSNKLAENGWNTLSGDSVTEDSELITYSNEGVKFQTFKELAKNFIFIKKNGKEECYPNLQTLCVDKNLKVKIKKIKRFIRHKTDKQLYEIQTNWGYKLKLTKDHSLIKIGKEGNLIKVKPEELCKGEYLYINTFTPRNKIISKNFTKEFYEFFGLWLADGCICKNDTIRIASKDKEGHELIQKFCNQQKVNYCLRPNKIDFIIKGVNFGRKMKELGFIGDSYTKRIPNWMFNEAEDNICNFIKGMFSGDGSVSGNETVYSTVDMELAKDLRKLLKIVGINSTINTSKTVNVYPDKKRNRIYCNNSYSKRVVIHKLSMKKFIEKINFIQKRKNDKNKNFKSFTEKSLIWVPNNIIKYIYPLTYYKYKCLRKNTLVKLLNDINVKEIDKKLIKKIINGDIISVKIRKIKKCKVESQYVYDLEIDENHNFFANNLLVSNTDSLFIQLKTENTQDNVKEINEKINILIKQAIDEFVKIFLPEELIKENTLEMEAEKIYKSLLLLDVKKRYIGILKYFKGKETDQINYMGLDLKKSNTIKVSKEAQMDLAIAILKNEDVDKVFEKYYSLIRSSQDLDMFKIPSKLEKNQNEYKVNSPAVRSSLWSNKNLGTKFRGGTKYFIIYTKPNQKINTDVIAFESIEQLLDLDIEIDKDKYLKDIHNKFNNLIRGIPSINSKNDIYYTRYLKNNTSLQKWF